MPSHISSQRPAAKNKSKSKQPVARPRRQRARSLAIICACTTSCLLNAQTFDALRMDGRPSGHVHDTGGSDPIIDPSTFADVGITNSDRDNINGPSLIRLPDWLADADRVHPDANYYLYFAHHSGRYIRMAWASELTGNWSLFNIGTATDRSWGANGNNTGEQTLGAGVLDLSTVLSFGTAGIGVSNHVASPDVLIDDVNQRFVMYFHSPRNGFGPSGQQTYVTTSSNGLNFNDPNEYGQTGHGPRDVMPTGGYLRSFDVNGSTFAYSNTGELWRAPLLNTAGEPNTLANADSPGGLWTVNAAHDHGTTNWWDLISDGDNPIRQLYTGQVTDPRHFGTYTRHHIDPADENVYVFYSSRNDSPESIFLTVIDTDNSSVNPADWTPVGQRIALEPTLDWEGADLPFDISLNGSQEDVRQLRDPSIFEDTMGTADPSDDQLYLLYTGEGEEAIGLSQLTFLPSLNNTAAPQGDLFPDTEVEVDEISVDYNGNGNSTQTNFEGTGSGGDGNGLFAPTTLFTNPFGGGNVSITMSADRWKVRPPITGNHSDQTNLLSDFAGPVTGASATLTLEMPSGDYEVTLYQHESNRSSAETASLQITDADGNSGQITLTSGFGTSPTEITTTVHSVHSNGVDDVVFTIDNTDSQTTGAYPINGVTISVIEAPETPDNDQDDIPNQWEIDNGLDPFSAGDRDEDPDSDGFTNFEEWVALTDPNDASSKLNPTYSLVGTNLTLSFDGSPERLYSVISSADLGPTDEWNTVVAPRAGQGVADEFILVTVPQEPRMFYRLVIETP